MIPTTLSTGAAACLFFSSVRVVALTVVALLICLYPLKALALVAALTLVLAALAAVFLLNLFRGYLL